MEAQQIYNTVRDHLLKQNHRAIHEGLCVFHSRDGLKCAIGCLIPDDKYAPEIEGKGVTFLIEFDYLPHAYEDHYTLLRNLQSVHDFASPSDWKVELAKVAVVYGLEP